MIVVDDYRDAGLMLKNIANGVRMGEFGDIKAVAVVTRDANGVVEVFGGGMLSEMDDTIEALQDGLGKLEEMMKHAEKSKPK